jgi:hypothetical protein
MREPGFYWVKVTAESEPEVALRVVEGDRVFWKTAGSECDVSVSEVLSARVMSPGELELMNVVDLVRHLVQTVRMQGVGYTAKGDGFSVHISDQEGADRASAKRRAGFERASKRAALARARKEG